MYQAAKHTDQNGDKILARQILYQLHDATTADGRVIRRLARLAVELNEEDEARRLLQLGIRLNPNNGYFWHGLAQLELRQDNVNAAREFYQKAISVDKTLPNPYHAWARLEQSEGNIRVAAALLRRGLRNSPRNHRLWHALGGLYRDAGMNKEATHAFEKGVKHGSNWSKPFFYTELAYVAYEMGDVELVSRRLREGLEINGGKHAQGWVALAQLEESLGNIARARVVYQDAADAYERARRIQLESGRHSASSTRMPSQPGDKWLTLYLNWAKMEEAHNNPGYANMVYSRTAHVFPNEWCVFLNWAMHQAERKYVERSRVTFERACQKAERCNADPYRIYAEHEMDLGNYDLAREIFFTGAKTISNSRDGQGRGLAALMHSWAICELKVNNTGRASDLLEQALCLTEKSGEKSQILSTMAQLELSPLRQNYRVAQHCVSVAIRECTDNSRASSLWNQWAYIAEQMQDEFLAHHCREQANAVHKKSRDELNSPPLPATSRTMKEALGKAPWYNKILYKR